jgi:hypothetical protein
MCIDYTGLNKSCPKDEYPLACICQIVDSTMSYELLSFLNAYSGYPHISLVIDDEEYFVTQRWHSASRMGELHIRRAFRSSWKLRSEDMSKRILMM